MSRRVVPKATTRSVAIVTAERTKQPTALTADKTCRQPGISLASRHTASSLQKYGNNAASKELKDVLERKIEDLSRQLAQEKQTSRQTKTSLSRLQREVSRSKTAERPVNQHDKGQVDLKINKEQLSKELEHEKMLRAEAEHRLQEMTKESENCRSRLASLQDEFRKMEDMVRDMVQYKSKIDQLKQEKSSLSSSYETRLEKFQSHITDLERENILLLNEVKKLESQMSHRHDTSPDRSKLLLERLRMLEGENSSLVLENEQQRGQYEKCLDEIANQVVQALLAQKMLREECFKLQNRVHDLELQNKQLCTIFQHKVKMSKENKEEPSSEGETIMVQGSIDSLQSIFTEQMSEHLATAPQTSSSSPWLQERLPGDRHSVTSLTGSIMSMPEHDHSSSTSLASGFSCKTRIETEFPATPSSPKSKHINVVDRQNEKKRSSSVSSLASKHHGPNKQRTRSTSSLSRVRGLSFLSPPDRSQSNDSGIQNATTNEMAGNNVQNSTEQSVKNVVPLNKSNPSISSQLAQGHTSRSGSKIPGLQVKSQVNSESRLRRNSLKAEYSIRMGCQSPISKSLGSATGKITQPKTQSNSSRPSSVESFSSQGHSRSPSVSSVKSTSSKIPGFRNSQSNLSKLQQVNSKENVSTQSKTKTVSERQTSTSKMASSATTQSKLIPPRSPTLRYSGIRTTLKTESASSKTAVSKTECTTKVPTSSITTPATIKSVYAINPSANRQSQIKPFKGTSKPPIPSRGEKQMVYNRPDTHYPIMGLTNLNHTSPKNEDASKIYVNLFSSKSIFSSNQNSENNSVSNNEPGEMSALKQAQYFYDYSDEDSDVNINRPVSKDFSVASTVSLDELLDQTLENIKTPVDGDFSSEQYLFSLRQVPLHKSSSGSNRSSAEPETPKQRSSPYDSVDGVSNKVSQVVDKINTSEKTNSINVLTKDGKPSSWKDNTQNEKENRLHGKPDIVKDTEECEQRNMHKSIKVSQIPGSSMPGYRAKRPKSLVLGAKDKKFLYCEYGSSSSSDSSDEEWSYQLSYAKNIKQHEIQSKVAKSIQSGQAKIIESPKGNKTVNGAIKNNKTVTKGIPITTQKEINKPSSLIPKVNSSMKKQSKIPPPIAAKPTQRKSNQKPEVQPRPKSVEICVNTVLASTQTVTCYSYMDKSDRKSDSVKYLKNSGHVTMSSTKSFDPDLSLNSTFDEVKVERSGSKDDGYSTMSSDVQPEMMEKYADPFESSTNSNEIRNSNLSLSSQNSFSSEDRPSTNGSLSRVRAMKMKFDIENNTSPEKEDERLAKSPPLSPLKTAVKSAKTSLLVKPTTVTHTSTSASDKPKVISKIPMSKPGKEATVVSKPRSSIPLPKSALVKKDDIKDSTTKTEVSKNKPVSPSSVNRTIQTTPNKMEFIFSNPMAPVPQTSTPTSLDEEFNNLAYFSPTLERIEFLKDASCDSNSSLSDRGSDLTSLHISEDNILSDIPEEKEGYESSVGHRSGNPSFSSLPNVSPKKTGHTASHNSHVQHHHTMKFTTTLKKHWSSLQGLCRAAEDRFYEQQKTLKNSADYDELYGGCLNIETLNERSTSESDLYNRGDKPEVVLLPRLRRSRSDACLHIDEFAIEEMLQALLKADMLRQIQKNVDSADKDEANFTSFVELLIQRGHVMEQGASPGAGLSSKEDSPVLNKMTVSNLSSKVNTPSVDAFVSEEKPGAGIASQNSSAVTSPVGEEQKKFNSQFYSLCNTGSVKSISEKSDPHSNDARTVSSDMRRVNDNTIHTCHTGDTDCNKCIDEKNKYDFDDISRQIESLSRTVNALHKSLTSLNSENSDSGSESNEGDSVLTSAIGNKDIDGYQWVEDEFFLSPYGGEVILGGSPFSETGASCEWMNEYTENFSHFVDELGGQEGLHEEPLSEQPANKIPSKVTKSSKHDSLLASGLDEEGNFDSKKFISRRLQQEEFKRKGKQGGTTNLLDNAFDIHNYAIPNSSRIVDGVSNKQGRLTTKEELRMTPEKDLDETETFANKKTKREKLPERTAEYGGSQDSLDDNIGVDNMMCHRLIGGKGSDDKTRSAPYTRPRLDFSNSQFIRYSDPEKEAVSAFDFLNEMGSSNMSDQSNERLMFDLDMNRGTHFGDKNRMTLSTTSNESRASPVKKNRRKLRPKTRKDTKTYQKALADRKLSSTSADSNIDSDGEISFSDSFCDSYSSSDNETLCQAQPKRQNNMTYI